MSFDRLRILTSYVDFEQLDGPWSISTITVLQQPNVINKHQFGWWSGESTAKLHNEPASAIKMEVSRALACGARVTSFSWLLRLTMRSVRDAARCPPQNDYQPEEA